jgi:cytochrome P450
MLELSHDGLLTGGNLPPGSMGQPLVGEAKEFSEDPIGFLWDRYRRHGPIFKTSLGGPIVFMVGPEANRFVLRDHTEHFSWAQGWPKYVRLVWGDDVLVMKDGEEHTRLRQMFAPAFAHNTLSKVFDYVVDSADEYVEGWITSEPHQFFQAAKTVVFEWMFSWLVGDIRREPRREAALKLFEDFTAIPPVRHGSWRSQNFRDPESVALRRRKFLAKSLLLRYFDSVAERTRAQPEDNVISLLARQPENGADALTNQQIAEHALLFLVTGADATATAFVWAVYEIYNHPEVKQRLREEVDRVVGTGTITWKHLQRMDYLECFVKEIERVHPPLGGVRKIIQPFEFGGFDVPAGWALRLAAVISHALPDVFKDPDRFDPDRFAPPREEDRRTPYSMIGFGAGHRQCTGKPLALILLQAMIAKMVRDYDWVAPSGQDVSPMLYNRAVFPPRDMLKVRFSRREQPVAKAVVVAGEATQGQVDVESSPASATSRRKTPETPIPKAKKTRAVKKSKVG